jgi:hypothetical protein
MDSPSDQVLSAKERTAGERGARQAPVLRAFDFRILRDGTWLHEGRPIRRLPLVRLFATVLRREPDGSYWLQTPVERGRIEVEDTPFVGVELEAEGAGSGQRLRLRTNLDDWVIIGPEHPLRVRPAPWAEDGEATLVPYVEVRPGLEARLLRPVFYELAELAEPHAADGCVRQGVWSAGCFFPLDEAPG